VHYLGSKEKLIPFIHKEITQRIDTSITESKIFCDLFAGTGVVGRHFAQSDYKIISNDAEYYSYLINHAYLINNSVENYAQEIQTLNQLQPKEGLIFKHYAQGGGEARNYFSDHNAKKIDAIRQEIERWYQSQLIPKERYFLLLATLIQSATYVANTASIYSAFLKTLKKTAQTPIVLETLHVNSTYNLHEVYQRESNTLIKEISGDILYLDPPYNLRQYGANYHLLNTIAEYQPFSPRGKTGLRAYYSSPFSRRKSAYTALKTLLENATFSHIFLSYNSDGIIDNAQIAKMMKSMGTYEQVHQSHKRFNAKNATQKQKTTEYLHILNKPYM
jgi:adenine-specific DNA-methyltransferase